MVAEKQRPYLLILLACLLCVLVGLWGYSRESYREPDDTGDEGFYFEEAARMAEEGGPLGYLKLAFHGKYVNGAPNPLLAMLSSPFAGRSLDFVRPARLFKAILTIISLLIILLLAARAGGWERGALVIVMLALSRNWLGKAAVFTPDPINYALMFAGWVLIAGIWQPKGRWLWAGAIFGLAYLSKGTALLLLAGLGGAVAWRLLFQKNRKAALRSRTSWAAAALFIVGALVVASPALVQGTFERTEANPLSRYLPSAMWLDSWEQRFAGEEAGTAEGYFQRHNVLDLGRRMLWGMTRQAPRFAGVFAVEKESAMPLFALSVLISALLVAWALWRLTREENHWARLFTFMFILAGFLLYSWFSAITYASRFAATFGPVFAWYAAGGVTGLLERSSHHRRWVNGVVILAIAALLISNGARLPANPAKPLPVPEDYARLMNWYEEAVVNENKVCLQTLKLGWRFRFMWIIGASQAQSPDVPPLQDYPAFMKYADDVNAGYLLVERAAPALRSEIFGPYLKDDLVHGLIQTDSLPGWTPVLQDDDGVTDYIAYRRK